MSVSSHDDGVVPDPRSTACGSPRREAEALVQVGAATLPTRTSRVSATRPWRWRPGPGPAAGRVPTPGALLLAGRHAMFVTCAESDASISPP